jgi:hypothetical protein
MSWILVEAQSAWDSDENEAFLMALWILIPPLKSMNIETVTEGSFAHRHNLHVYLSKFMALTLFEAAIYTKRGP